MARSKVVVGVLILALGSFAPRGVGLAARDDLARQLRELDTTVLPAAAEPAKHLAQYARARLREANRRDSRAWQHIQTRADWEQYRDVRLHALRASLGTYPPVPRDLKVQVTRTLGG